MIRIYSFSYMFKQDRLKIIQDCDLIIDCRHLPDPQGKGIGESGLEKAIEDYVFASGEADQVIENVFERGFDGLPQDIAFGCEGGKNRSVALAENLRTRITVASLKETAKSGYNKVHFPKLIHLGLLEWGIKQ